MTTRAPTLAGVDLTDLDNFASGFPHDLFQVHRREAPVWWHEPTAHTPDGEGFWSVATYAETMEVVRQPDIYSSEKGGDRQYGGTMLQDLPTAGLMLNMMDDPRHARIRRLVTTGLTPRMVRRLESELRERTARLLDAAAEREAIDFLVDVAAEPPMQMICILLGVPEGERHWLGDAANQIFDIKPGREVWSAGTPAEADARRRMSEYGMALVAEKRARPTDDMLSVVVQAELADVDPPALSDGELYAFFSLLFSAGAETTRNAIAGGLLALIECPDQMEALRSDRSLIPTAVEEMVRWTSPSPSKRRTATTRVTLTPSRGAPAEIEPGQKIVFWEGSANRDEEVFDRSMDFLVDRQPNPHLGFGHGVHFCLGANLARLEMRVMFEQLLERFSAFELTGPVEWTRSNRHTGMRHMPVRVSP